MTALTLVGAGRIGLPVAARLVAAGHTVDVVDSRAELHADVEAVGARWSGPTVEVLPVDGLLVTVLPGSPELRDVMLPAPDGSSPGALAQLAPGSSWIDLTSAAPDLAADLAAASTERGVRYLDAGIGGGPQDARRGGLTLYVGGEGSDVQRLRPVLEAFADPARIHHMGGHGTGYLTKLLVNQLWFGQVVATTEALLVGAHGGVEPHRLATVLDGSAAASAFVHDHLPSLLAGDHLPAFGLSRVVEELDSLERLAESTGSPWSVSRQVTQLHRQAWAHFGDVDGELLGAAWLEHLAGRTLAGTTPAEPGAPAASAGRTRGSA